MIVLTMWMFVEQARSAPRARREIEMDQLSGESDIGVTKERSEMDSNDKPEISNSNSDELPLNAGRQVKMDNYEILKKRNRILNSGNVDLLVDMMIEEEIDASEKWNKIEVGNFPVSVEELHLVDNDLEIFKEMMNKVNFLEKQMNKPADQHVAVKPFDKNLKIVKSQILKLDKKLDSDTMNFVEEFLIRAGKFVKEAQDRFHQVSNSKAEEDFIKVTMYDNLDELLKDRVLQDTTKEAVEEEDANEAVEEDVSRHYHPKFKYYWNKEIEESHQHLHPTDKSDAVIKSSISNSWFGWSLDVFALVAFLLIVAVVIIGKLTLCRTKGSFHKVAKC